VGALLGDERHIAIGTPVTVDHEITGALGMAIRSRTAATTTSRSGPPGERPRLVGGAHRVLSAMNEPALYPGHAIVGKQFVHTWYAAPPGLEISAIRVPAAGG
jgi:hypothetical protein